MRNFIYNLDNSLALQAVKRLKRNWRDRVSAEKCELDKR